MRAQQNITQNWKHEAAKIAQLTDLENIFKRAEQGLH